MAPLAVGFWTDAWREAQMRSVLRRSQDMRPDRWADFYEQVADVWLELQGDPWQLGCEVAVALANNDVIGAGSRILDLGCGPGTLAIPLAKRGAEVTAVDASPRMTARLKRLLAEQRVHGVEVRTADWDTLAVGDRRDIGLAACFPPALSPAGIERLEALSQLTCAIVMGVGSEPFPFRRQIWQRLMSDPLPDVREHLTCLIGYLLATERRPNLRHLEWNTRLDVQVGSIRDFYGRYFRLLEPDRSAAEIDAAIGGALAPFVQHGRCRAEGPGRVALVWWSVRDRELEAL